MALVFDFDRCLGLTGKWWRTALLPEVMCLTQSFLIFFCFLPYLILESLQHFKHRPPIFREPWCLKIDIWGRGFGVLDVRCVTGHGNFIDDAKCSKNQGSWTASRNDALNDVRIRSEICHCPSLYPCRKPAGDLASRLPSIRPGWDGMISLSQQPRPQECVPRVALEPMKKKSEAGAGVLFCPVHCLKSPGHLTDLQLLSLPCTGGMLLILYKIITYIHYHVYTYIYIYYTQYIWIIPTYLPTCLPTYMHTCTHACIYI